jgi:hypothetical protein
MGREVFARVPGWNARCKVTEEEFVLGRVGRSVEILAGRALVRRVATIAFLVAGVHMTARPLVDEVPSAVQQTRKAQRLADEMRVAIGIEPEVRVVAVAYHPLVFSVEPVNSTREQFILSVELGFLVRLDDDELRAALAHELGHVWIFTHHPFLQTERLANDIARPLADRDSFERVYRKLWDYEDSPGVSIDALLGPAPSSEEMPAGRRFE